MHVLRQRPRGGGQRGSARQRESRTAKQLAENQGELRQWYHNRGKHLVGHSRIRVETAYKRDSPVQQDSAVQAHRQVERLPVRREELHHTEPCGQVYGMMRPASRNQSASGPEPQSGSPGIAHLLAKPHEIAYFQHASVICAPREHDMIARAYTRILKHNLTRNPGIGHRKTTRISGVCASGIDLCSECCTRTRSITKREGGPLWVCVPS